MITIAILSFFVEHGITYIFNGICSYCVTDSVGFMVGNEVKGKIPKRCLQENKARHIFRKTNIPCTWNAHVSAHIGVKKCYFFEKFGLLCFLVTTVLRFVHLPYYRHFGPVNFLFRLKKHLKRILVNKWLRQLSVWESIVSV